MSETFLDKTYGCMTAEATRAHYDDWAASYDAEISENGYATPTRCAEALARHLPDKSAPILDFACGTGLSGLAMTLQGFDRIDGVDVSPGMLDGARERGLYRHLIKIDAGAVEIELPYREDLTQQHLFLHAGVISTILDSACGYAAFSLMPADSAVLSVEFKVNLIAAAEGRRLVARADVLRDGRTLKICRVDVHALDGDARKHCATALATIMALKGSLPDPERSS